MVYYIDQQIAEIHKADRLAIKKAIDEQDQRDLEKQIGNPNPGEASHSHGSIIVDALPNVLPRPKTK